MSNFLDVLKNDRFGGENATFDVLNPQSQICRTYSLHVPLQITYEFISGASETDYLNALTLSEKGSFLCREQALMHNESRQHTLSHSHDYYEMMIVLDGSVSQTIEENVYTYDAGSVCFLNRNLSHKEQFHERAQLLFLGFSLDYLRHLFHQAKHSHFPNEMQFFETTFAHFVQHDMHHAGEKAYLDFIPTMKQKNPYRKLHDLSEQLIDAMLQPRFGGSALIDGLIGCMLSYITDVQNYHCTTVELKSSGDYLLFMRIEHLLEEADGRLSRAELSELLNYSGDYINRITKKYSGLSLHEYTLKFAMRKAAYRLSETKASTAKILHDLGFTNRTYFYKAFKKQYGMTPNEYRKHGKE